MEPFGLFQEIEDHRAKKQRMNRQSFNQIVLGKVYVCLFSDVDGSFEAEILDHRITNMYLVRVVRCTTEQKKQMGKKKRLLLSEAEILYRSVYF
ncbi:hypothetical protein EH331_10600 [Enterococcus faecalis]|nr:hypothetical protein [Enterococcus faecalis]